ncbi:hypothetical protein HK100_005888, partial [Physocladia obscura]
MSSTNTVKRLLDANSANLPTEAIEAGTSSADQCGNPRKKPGRKPVLDKPQDERTARSRENQRALRVRNASHVKNLEEKVVSLTREIETQGPSHLEIELRKRAAKLETENAMLRQTIHNLGFSMEPFAATTIDDNLRVATGIIDEVTVNNSIEFEKLFSESIATTMMVPPLIIQAETVPLSTDLHNEELDLYLNEILPNPGLDFTTFREPHNTAISFFDDDNDIISALLRTVPENVPRDLIDMTFDERCKYVKAEIPALSNTYNQVRKLPSLESNEKLIDDLCAALI